MLATSTARKKSVAVSITRLKDAMNTSCKNEQCIQAVTDTERIWCLPGPAQAAYNDTSHNVVREAPLTKAHFSKASTHLPKSNVET